MSLRPCYVVPAIHNITFAMFLIFSTFRGVFPPASLELDDDFDVSVPDAANRTLNASFNISSNIEQHEEINEK